MHNQEAERKEGTGGENCTLGQRGMAQKDSALFALKGDSLGSQVVCFNEKLDAGV